MNLHQAVSLCASVVGGGVAPFLPVVGLSATWVTGCSADLRMSVDCDTGLTGPTLWVQSKGLVEVLHRYGPDASLQMVKGVLHAVSGTSKTRIPTLTEGPAYESPTGGNVSEYAPAPLSIALTRAMSSCDPDAGHPWMRGVIFGDGVVICARTTGLAVTPLAGAKPMPVVPLVAAKAVVRAIESGAAGIVKVRASERDAEWMIGDVRIRSPFIDAAPPIAAVLEMAATHKQCTHSVVVLRAALMKAVEDAAVARAFAAGSKTEPPLEISMEEARVIARSGEDSEAKCEGEGKVTPKSVLVSQVLAALKSIDSERVTLYTSTGKHSCYLVAGDEIRVFQPVVR